MKEKERGGWIVVVYIFKCERVDGGNEGGGMVCICFFFIEFKFPASIHPLVALWLLFIFCTRRVIDYGSFDCAAEKSISAEVCDNVIYEIVINLGVWRD